MDDLMYDIGRVVVALLVYAVVCFPIVWLDAFLDRRRRK